MYPRNVVCFRNIFVNTLYKGDNIEEVVVVVVVVIITTKQNGTQFRLNTAQTPLNFSLGP
jgi:hypothetical protein